MDTLEFWGDFYLVLSIFRATDITQIGTAYLDRKATPTDISFMKGLDLQHMEIITPKADEDQSYFSIKNTQTQELMIFSNRAGVKGEIRGQRLRDELTRLQQQDESLSLFNAVEALYKEDIAQSDVVTNYVHSPAVAEKNMESYWSQLAIECFRLANNMIDENPQISVDEVLKAAKKHMFTSAKAHLEQQEIVAPTPPPAPVITSDLEQGFFRRNIIPLLGSIVTVVAAVLSILLLATGILAPVGIVLGVLLVSGLAIREKEKNVSADVEIQDDYNDKLGDYHADLAAYKHTTAITQRLDSLIAQLGPSSAISEEASAKPAVDVSEPTVNVNPGRSSQSMFAHAKPIYSDGSLTDDETPERRTGLGE